MSILKEQVLSVMPAGMMVIKPQAGYAQWVGLNRKLRVAHEDSALFLSKTVAA